MNGDCNTVSVFLLSDGRPHEMHTKVEKIVDAAIREAGGTARIISRFGEWSATDLVEQRIIDGNPFELIVLPIPSVRRGEGCGRFALAEAGKRGGSCVVAVISESVDQRQSSIADLEMYCKIFRLSNDNHAKVHRYMTYDQERCMYRKLNGELIDTKEKARLFYLSLRSKD